MKTMKKILTLSLALMMVLSCMAPALAAALDFDPTAFEETVELEDVVADGVIEPLRYEPCACGAPLVTVKTGETGFVKGPYHMCEHGLNGNLWKNIISYVTRCQSCGSGTPFTKTETEVRCNH